MIPRNRALVLAEVVRLHARHQPAKPAIVDDHGTTTFGELWDGACAVAGHLRERGLRPGDIAAVALEPDAGHVAVLLGVMVAGGVVAPLNIRLTPFETGDYLDRLGAAWHLTEPVWQDLVPATAPGRVVLPAGSGGLSAAERFVGIAAAPLDRETPVVDEESAAVAFPTGGTTGTPKAALWTHRNLFLAVQSSCTHLGVRPWDVELYVSPFFHVTLVPGLFATLAVGATALVPARFDPGPAARILAAGEATRMFGTPTVIDRMLAQLPAGSVSDADPTIVFGASRSDDGFVARLHAAFPRARLFSGYGATEVGAVVRLYPDDVLAGGRGVGRPVAGVSVRVVDDTGADVAPGTPGEIAIASPWQMTGYVGRPGEEQRLADGSIRSGDIGHLDADGFLHLAGRLKETIKSAGENVFPAEVERVLLAHPAVADAAVFGRDDAEWGQRVEAVLVVAPGATFDETAIRAFCRERLAGFKVPKRFHPVDELPYTGTMKLDRRRLASLPAVQA